ncbi:hypothetical protein B484DRAFT_394506 [Ochromonadaceae sp. CCMP2298]|nr:hypothetical protein B484DRAFT_394506 [Ochromonadaceae sp. CCMP2298]
MIVRVRSNLGSTRLQLTCGPETILVDLIALVRAALNIREAGAGAGNSDNVQLAADLAGERLLNSSEATLRQLGVAHGDELFLVGRWEVVTVGVGSFVSGEGELVARGTLRRIDAPAVTTPGTADTAPAVNTTDFSETPSPAAQTEKRGRGERKAGEMEERGEVAVAATAPTTVNVTAHTNTAVPISLAVPELESPYASVPASTLTAMAMAAAAEERDRGGWDWGGDGDGELVRAPDAVRREALLGPDSPWGAGGAGRGLQLLAGDELQLRERGAFLRGAGMREGEVQAEVGELRDLLLAQR